ncbi:manganese efflux pump MntP [Lacrimispora defluvii]|uniref:Putative manganese efflux pump MntP n=1 Tax=Lacrimispora defluvii TaxID=2719233 RepID=A0ABX1VN62_9FIRM|nr:manganese efflux pump MntP family protein [Lacrimispora defluvii]NNJ29849.1 manganese efflux pump [Lacrimispora defluvii]
MSLLELFIIALGLSMDAFAVSICKGLCMPQMNWKNAVIAGLYFGGFQAGMPVMGYLLGSQFKEAITSYDHWIAFFLLGIIGINMIKESFSKEEVECADCSLDPKNMFMLAIATSIDALAVGVTFAFLKVQIIPAVSFIGATTFTLSIAGIIVGNVFGSRFKSKAEFSGGIILIVMGVKILFQHLFEM